MKKNFLLAAFSMLLLHVVTAQSYTRLWVNKFQDTSASWHTNDMTVDAAGNAYITGYFNKKADQYWQTHFFLSKISATGKQEWIRYFTPALDSIDAGTAVAADSLGYIYVTGSRVDTFCNICTVQSKVSDVITMKYDAAGNRIWLNRYHDSVYVLASPSTIQVQPNGIVCVVGNEDRYNFTTTQYSSNLLVQKISANGTTSWVRKKDKAVGSGVCFDKNNNVIVAGAYDPSYDYMTQKPAIFKYGQAGTFQYSTVYDERNKNGRFYLVACDADNNIYANGQTDTIAFNNNPHILTAKYNATGEGQWYRSEQAHSYTTPHYYGSFALDADGNSYVTGYVKVTDLNNDIITTKYNSAGTRQWIKQFDGSLHGYDVPADLALDKKGNVFVTGYSSAKGGYDYVTLGYTGTGNQVGVDYYSSGARTNNFPAAIGADNNGNVLVTGITTAGLATLKYGKKATLIAQIEQPVSNNIRMYPNPAKDAITIVYNTSANIQATDCFVSDMYGNVLMQKSLPLVNGMGTIRFTLQALHTGIYVIKVKEGDAFISKSFLKE